MLVAVISDIHDRVSNLRLILNRLSQHHPGLLICCGDITKPTTLLELAALDISLHFCLGNCDAENARQLLSQGKQKGFQAARRLGSLVLPDGSGQVAFAHFPELALEAAKQGQYKAVFYGHTHKAKMEYVRQKMTGQTNETQCLFANPGDIQGRFGSQPSALLWDSVAGSVGWVKA